MKKYIFISVAALFTLAACTKVTTGDGADTQREINFEVANYAQTKANVAYDTEVPFGTYAWFNDGSGVAQDFMINERVGYIDNVWKTSERPFYWPKTGNIDFISYSPFAGTNGKRPAAPAADAEAGTAAQEEETPVAPEPIIKRVKDKDFTFEYGKYRANGSQFDLMYADLAAAKNQNESTYTDISGVNGVPTLFHHALARVSFKLKANFLEYTEEGSTTKWEVWLQEAYLYGLRHSGTLKLTMDANQQWVKPANNVWTADPDDEGIMLYSVPEAEEGAEPTGEIPGIPLSDKEYYVLMPEQFVLPQMLYYEDGQIPPQLSLTFYIRTTLSSGKVITEVCDSWIPLYYYMPDGMAKAWQMNQRFLYTINLKPTAGTNHPDDPSDVSILFSPMTEGWDVVEPTFEIEL